MNNSIEIEIEIKRETDKAYLVFNGKNDAWIPKSKISDYCEEKDGKITSIFIPEWMAIEKGLI